MTLRSALLLNAATLFASPALAQEQAAPATPPAASAPPQAQAPQSDEDTGDDEEIVVTGQRARGSAIGDIPPEQTLDSRDVRATGATNISELLDALAPQIGSAQGRGGEQPVLLLNGQRISSFRELRDIPTEAIERVDILPEEVALKYGYRADQKVVNIVLRRRFRSTVAQAAANAATEGGYAGATGDVTRLLIGNNNRTTLNLHAQGNGMLTEAERDVTLSEPPMAGTVSQALAARSLLPTKEQVRGSATINRQVLGNVSGTLNAELEHDQGRALIGLGDTLLEPLARNTTTDSAHLGTTLNWDKSNWHWNIVGNADLDRNRTNTEHDSSLFPHSQVRETTFSGDLTATANGTLFKLPAGDASTTVSAGASAVHLDDRRQQDGVSLSNSLARSTGTGKVSLDLPISRRGHDFDALGNLTLNANAEVDQLSDFGTLTTIGAGANFSPIDRLNFIGSWTREEGPPTINQLGDPILETPNTRIFDFTTGQTVLVTAITGGNRDLEADRRTVVKLGTNWQPFAKTDFRLRADYVHQTIDRPIQNIFGPTPALEAAFPDRFVRNSEGQLVSIDLRPLNFDQSRKDTLRVGFDFTKPLKSKRPSQSVIDQIRAQFGARPGAGPPGGAAAPGSAAPPSGPPPEGGPPPPGGGGGRGGGYGGRGFGGGGGGGFFGGSRGRLQLSVTDTITFVDKVTIGPGLPVLDYLHGEAAGANGGTPRHLVEAQAGWSNNGLGARLGANWRSGTVVDSLDGNNLHFSPLATFDLRLFDNLGDQPELVLKHPWLRSTQVRLDLTNVFDSKPKVHDAFGNTPSSYQPDLLDPLGRTVMISFRKLFSPPPSYYRQQREREQQQQQQPALPSPQPTR